jgi:FKBP-type peptidyl-prolyl cis-trans isomerase 2
VIDIADMPGSEELEVDQRIVLEDGMGRQFPVVVMAKNEKTITFDANHRMAGKALNFDIELVSVEE